MARNLGFKAQRRRTPGRSLPSLVAASLHTPALMKLAPREQEIATIVYMRTDVTARDLEDALAHEITNSAIRVMLGRLVDKGILRRRKGHGKTFIYSPALLLPDIQERALERLAEDYFDGSLTQASHRLLSLIGRRDPEALQALGRQITASAAPFPMALAEGARSAG
jgi:predicted transcriptional regulator